MHEETSYDISILEFLQYTYCLFNVTHLLLLKLADCALDSIFSFVEVLILVNGSGEIEREVCVDDMVDGVCKGFLGVKEVELVWSDGGTDIVHQGSGQWMSVNRVA